MIFMIQLSSIIIGLLILIIPCLIAYLLIKKLIKKDEQNSDLELRVHILEQELEEVKRHINFIDEF